MAEAEDIVQDVWLRWHAAAGQGIDNAEAWLVAVTTRISIDRLRAAKIQREHYAGMWLPEPQKHEQRSFCARFSTQTMVRSLMQSAKQKQRAVNW